MSRRDSNVMRYAPALAALDPDVVVLSEYVPDDRYHQRVCDDFRSLGYRWQMQSNGNRGNRVLIVSRIWMRKSELPQIESRPDRYAEANFAHAYLANGVHLVGLRAPLYNRASEHSTLREQIFEYRSWLMTKLKDLRSEPTIVIGDLNSDPTNRFNNMIEFDEWISDGAGWEMAQPEGPCSHYIPNKSVGGSVGDPAARRINHALVTPKLLITKPSRYIYEIDDLRASAGGNDHSDDVKPEAARYVFASRDRSSRMSDHAVLLVDVVERAPIVTSLTT